MDVENFLQTFRTDSRDFTHLLMKGGKFYVPPKKHKELYKLAFNGTHSLLLKPAPNVSRLRFDIDLIKDCKTDERLFEPPEVEKCLIEIYKIISNVTGTSIFKRRCIVTFRELPYYLKRKGITKDGFHLFFPTVFCDEQSYNHLIADLRKIFKKVKLFENQKNNGIDNIWNKWWFHPNASKFDRNENCYRGAYTNKVCCLFDGV